MAVTLGNTVWDHALEAAAERLRDQIPEWRSHWGDAPLEVETDRRAEVGFEEMPRLVVRYEEDEPDDAQVLGETAYTVTIGVSGYVRAYGEEAAAKEVRQTLTALRAAVTQALMIGWQSVQWIDEVREGKCDVTVYDAEGSAPAAGEFTARFLLTVFVATGHVLLPDPP